MQPRLMQRDGKPIVAVEADISQVRPWNPTVQQMRDVVLNWGIAGPDWTAIMDLTPAAKEFVPSQAEVERISELAVDAVIAGRVIDFGFLPNDVLKHGGDRGGTLWQQSAIDMPFIDPWILLHSWEGGTSIYLINPIGEDVEACELQPAMIDDMKSLLISDRGIFFRHHDGPATKYYAMMAPAALRFQRDPEHWARANNGKDEQASAAGNVGDPLMAAILILSTRNVQRETICAPMKLQNARRKSGKPPIPNYDRVDAALYVTAIVTRGHRRERGEDQGGSHRSPVPHIRIGHPRTYATGRSIFIRDTLVAVTDEQRAAFKSTRSHYEVKP